MLFSSLFALFFTSTILALPTNPVATVATATGVASSTTTMYSKLDWSVTDDMTIRDVNGSTLYKVDDKYWSIGKSFNVLDGSGKVVLKSSQKFWSWTTKHRISFLDAKTGKWIITEMAGKYFNVDAYNSFTFSVKGETFKSDGDFFKWKFSVTSLTDHVQVANVDMKGQDIIKFSWPGANVYESVVNSSRIDPVLIVAILAVAST